MQNKYPLGTSIAGSILGFTMSLFVVCWLPSNSAATNREAKVNRVLNELSGKVYRAEGWFSQDSDADELDQLSLQVLALNWAQRAIDHGGILLIGTIAIPWRLYVLWKRRKEANAFVHLSRS